MPTYTGGDGAALHYDVLGTEPMAPLIVLGGGPMLDPAYLGDLGGLARHRQLLLVNYRGTGQSEKPTDPVSYRCDHLVEDVEALRQHLRLDRIDLLAHCAGANLAALYATRHPERLRKLILITPSTRAVDINATSDDRRRIVRLRVGEPWFAPASKAFEAIATGHGTDADWEAITPFSYGRWDATAQTHHADEEHQQNLEAAALFGAECAYQPEETRAALATLSAPVLLLAGALDVAAPPRVMTEFAAVFANATIVTQPAAGHFPWLDDPTRFTRTVTQFLK